MLQILEVESGLVSIAVGSPGPKNRIQDHYSGGISGGIYTCVLRLVDIED